MCSAFCQGSFSNDSYHFLVGLNTCLLGDSDGSLCGHRSLTLFAQASTTMSALIKRAPPSVSARAPRRCLRRMAAAITARHRAVPKGQQATRRASDAHRYNDEARSISLACEPRVLGQSATFSTDARSRHVKYIRRIGDSPTSRPVAGRPERHSRRLSQGRWLVVCGTIWLLDMRHAGGSNPLRWQPCSLDRQVLDLPSQAAQLFGSGGEESSRDVPKRTDCNNSIRIFCSEGRILWNIPHGIAPRRAAVPFRLRWSGEIRSCRVNPQACRKRIQDKDLQPTGTL